MSLNDVMEFDCVIEVLPTGAVVQRLDIHAPELYDGELHAAYSGEGDGWTLMDGYSGQQGYSGPLMHQSEYIGGGMERDILSTPGLYVCLINTDADNDDPPTEWAVARKDV